MLNQEQVKGNWQQIKGNVKEKWGKLTKDDLAEIEGSTTKLVGKVTELYGITKAEASQQLEDFLKELGDSNSKNKSSDKDSDENINSKLQEVLSQWRDYVTNNPLKALGIGIGAGMLLSKILNRK